MTRRNTSVAVPFEDLRDDPDYNEGVRKRARLGILPPQLEKNLWDRWWGKPPDEVNVNIVASFASKSTDELLSIADNLRNELRQLQENTIDAEFSRVG